jgi:hypothetical protein
MSDLSRFSVGPIITEHYKALRAPGRRFLGVPTLLCVFILPLLAGVTTAVTGIVLPRSAVAPLLTGAGLLVGALISGFVLFTNLRIKIHDEPRWSYRTSVSRLVAQTAASCLYSVAIALVVVGGLVLGVSIPGLAANRALSSVGTGLIFALGLHLGVSFLTVLRRMFGVYVALFQSDFDPQLIDAQELTKQKRQA